MPPPKNGPTILKGLFSTTGASRQAEETPGGITVETTTTTDTVTAKDNVDGTAGQRDLPPHLPLPEGVDDLETSGPLRTCKCAKMGMKKRTDGKYAR